LHAVIVNVTIAYEEFDASRRVLHDNLLPKRASTLFREGLWTAAPDWRIGTSIVMFKTQTAPRMRLHQCEQAALAHVAGNSFGAVITLKCVAAHSSVFASAVAHEPPLVASGSGLQGEHV
jgi:hypothetical protein